MAIEKKPATLVPKDFQPPNSNPYRVRNGDSWGSVARQHSMGTWDLIRFNLKTSNPAEVNWYLNHYIGCNKQTRDRKNYIFSSSANPGIVYVPMKIIRVPPTEIEGKIPKTWDTISFWFRGVQGSISLWKILGYKKLRGDLGMRINGSASDWYAWQLSASLGTGSVPIKGSPPVSVGSIATTEHSFKYDKKLFDPRTDWKKRGVFVKIAGQTLWITIKNALPRSPAAGYEPIKGHTTRDLTLKLTMDGPELGGNVGIGGIFNGRAVKPTKPQNPYGIPGDGWA